MAKFIGLAALELLAAQISPEIALSAYFNKQKVFDKFAISVVSGIQFKQIKYLLLRKGHTTRRKEIGKTLRNTAGRLVERPLITYLSWNRYRDNMDSYREYPIADEASGTLRYPLSELALRAVMANYADDLYDCVWHGNHEIPTDDPNASLGLFDGFFTTIANDIMNGYVKPIHLSGAIMGPTDTSDKQAYDLFREFRDKWDVHLQSAPRVIVAMNATTAEAIADAFGNSKGNNQEVIRLENGNYKFPHWPNIEVAYDASIGIGDKMIAYTPGNLEYGVDTDNENAGITVQVGSDDDARDIFFQIQSAQGTRVVNVTPQAFAVTDAVLSPISLSGDYTNNTFSVSSNNEKWGTVTVDGGTPDNEKDYKEGTTLALVATPTGEGEFVKWSNGKTETSINVVTNGEPGAIVAIFKAKA